MELDVEFKRDVSFKGAHSLGVGIWGLRGREDWSWGRSSGGGEGLAGTRSASRQRRNLPR